MSAQLKSLPSPNGIEILELNPKNPHVPLPALVYCALSAKSSLTLDPFDQPVRFLSHENIRLLSITLPDHEEGKDPKEAMRKWLESYLQDPYFFDRFIQNAREALFSLIAEGFIDKDKIALAGLSRGGYVVLRLAAESEEFKSVMAFAPLIDPSTLLEFDQSIIDTLSLKAYIPKLIGKHIRIHVGNRDTRVSTAKSFEFIHELTEKSYEAGIRSPAVEMLIMPSIGHKGHGTSEESFQIGASWIKKELTS